MNRYGVFTVQIHMRVHPPKRAGCYRGANDYNDYVDHLG
jgi:hypothetical protein